MDDHIDAFIEALRNKASSGHTINNYSIDLKHFAEFMTRKATVVEVDDPVFLRDFLNHLYADRKLSKSSVFSDLACLNTFSKVMIRELLLNLNPAELISSP